MGLLRRKFHDIRTDHTNMIGLTQAFQSLTGSKLSSSYQSIEITTASGLSNGKATNWVSDESRIPLCIDLPISKLKPPLHLRLHFEDKLRRKPTYLSAPPIFTSPLLPCLLIPPFCTLELTKFSKKYPPPPSIQVTSSRNPLSLSKSHSLLYQRLET